MDMLNSIVSLFSKGLSHENETQSYTELKEKCLREGVLFEDEQFLTTDDSLPADAIEGGEVNWLRPKEIQSDATLYHEKPTKFDVNQGLLGDCWFLGSMANLPKYQSVFEFVLPPENANFEDKDYCGIFHFRFWYYGQWVEVVIDDRLPTRDGELILVSSEHPNVFWSALLEKAFAKLHGTYKRIEGGYTAESFEILTAGIGEIFMLKDETSKLFDYIQICLENHCLIGCSTSAEEEDRIESHGIVDHHAYSLTASKKISDEVLLVRIRNPWGNDKEWKGAWSDGSSEWNILGPEEIEELQLTFDPDGEYWMNWEDFAKQFTEVEIGYLDPFCYIKKDGTEDYVEHTELKMACINGTWTSADLYEKEEVKDENKEDEIAESGGNDAEKDEDVQASGNEEVTEESQDENLENNDIEEKKDNPEEETKEDKDEIIKEDDEQTGHEEEEEKVANEGNEEPESEENTVLAAKDSARSLQYLLKISKLDDDDDDKKYKIIVSNTIKNRRQIEEHVIFETNFDLFEFDKNQLSIASKLNEEFFENNKPIEGRWGYNMSEEYVGGFHLTAGEYALVLSSTKETEFFLRVYSSVDVQIHPLVNQSGEENEIDF